MKNQKKATPAEVARLEELAEHRGVGVGDLLEELEEGEGGASLDDVSSSVADKVVERLDERDAQHRPERKREESSRRFVIFRDRPKAS